ncbi:hypothetical protein ACVWZM_009064 [Bradyrhizobium sp. USDA 4501]
MITLPVSSSQSVARNGSVVRDGVVKVAIDPAAFLRCVRSGSDLLVVTRGVKILCVEGFFTSGDAQSPQLILVHNGKEWPVAR